MSRCQFAPRIPELAANLVQLYRMQTTDSDIVLGSDWYPKARAIVMDWATSYRLHDTTVACVIAAISPQCDWERNLIIADDVLAERPISIGGAIHSNITKAQRLLYDYTDLGAPAGKRMAKVFPYGPKVTSFATNLAGNDIAVTIDGHAMQAALLDPKADYRLAWTPYMCFAAAYESAAAKVNRSNAEFQAIIWHTWKRLYPRERKRILRKRWEPIGEF